MITLRAEMVKLLYGLDELGLTLPAAYLSMALDALDADSERPSAGNLPSELG
jgi:hypothetical protein